MSSRLLAAVAALLLGRAWERCVKFRSLIPILALSPALFICPASLAEDKDAAQACLDSDAFREPEETLERCERALKLSSATTAERAKFHLQRGLVFHWAARAYLSIPEFDAALKLDPKLHRARERRGSAYEQARQFDRAYQDFTDVLSADPRNADALFGLADLYYSTARHAYAVQFLEQALALEPNYHFARFRLAHHYANYADDLERALQEYERILSAAPGVLEAIPFRTIPPSSRDYSFRLRVQADRARVLMRADRSQEAYAVLDPQVKAFPKDAYLSALRGMISLDMNDLEAALVDAERAVELDPYVLDGQSVKMQTLFTLERYDEALAAANATISLSSREPPTYRLAMRTRAIIHKKLKKIAQAKADFEEVIRMGGMFRTDIVMRLKELGYYTGTPNDEYNSAMGNGLDACQIDPECYK